MNETWIASIWRLTGLLIFASFIGYLFGDIALSLLIALSSYTIWHIRQLWKFDQWVNHHLKEAPVFKGIWEDIGYRIFRIQKRSRQRKKRLAKILRGYQNSTNSFPDAGVVIDENGHILWFNNSAIQLLGFKSQDIHQHIGNLIRNSDFSYYLRNKNYEAPLEIISPLNEKSMLDVRVVPYSHERYLLLFRDVTHIKQLMTIRQDFVANVSHELKNPLTVILGYLENLSDINTNDINAMRTFFKQLKKVDEAAKRMKLIVDDLLVLAQLDAKPSKADDSPKSIINAPKLLENAINEAKILGPHHQFILDIDKNLDIPGDEKNFYSIFSNLINNAVRHTPEKTTITIHWQLKNEQIVFRVKDNGPGIASEHLTRLTERFYRVDSGRARKTGGSGLGLAIVKHAVEQCKGHLEIVSEINKGSEFICYFPRNYLDYKQHSNKFSSTHNDPPYQLH